MSAKSICTWYVCNILGTRVSVILEERFFIVEREHLREAIYYINCVKGGN